MGIKDDLNLISKLGQLYNKKYITFAELQQTQKANDNIVVGT